MFIGKALGVLAAILVFTTSLSTYASSGENGDNSLRKVPVEGTTDPSALLFTHIDLPDKEVILPDGTTAIQRGEVFTADVTNDQQLRAAIELEDKASKHAQEEGGLAELLTTSGDQKTRALMKELGISSDDDELRIPKDWKEWRQFYKEDFLALRANGFKIDPDNRSVTIIRTTLNWGVPFVMAIIAKGLPCWMALPYTMTLGLESGFISAQPMLFPWNRPFPQKDTTPLEAQEIKNKKIELTKVFANNLSIYSAVEFPFLGIPRIIMGLTNRVALYFNVSKHIDVSTFWGWHGFMATIAAGAFSQGLYEVGNARVRVDRLKAIEKYKLSNPKEYLEAKRKIKKSFFNVNFAASVAEVSLATLAVVSQGHPLTPWLLLGSYAGGGFLFSTYAFDSKIAKKIASFFGISLDKIKWGMTEIDEAQPPDIEKEPPLIEKRKVIEPKKFVDRCRDGFSKALHFRKSG